MITSFIRRLFRNHSVVFCLALLAMGAGFITFADDRNYLQFLPITPFMDPYAPSRDYLCRQAPPSPWAITPRIPSAEEIDLYQAKMEALKDVKSQKESKGPTVGTKFTNDFFSIPTISPSDQTPSTPSTQIDVSPWILIKPVPPSQQPEERPSLLPWLKKPIGDGSDLYIPFGYTPGSAPPVSSSSAVIYSQPEGKPETH